MIKFIRLIIVCIAMLALLMLLAMYFSSNRHAMLPENEILTTANDASVFADQPAITGSSVHAVSPVIEKRDNATDYRVEDTPQLDFADLNDDMNGQGEIAEYYYALSPDEASWMDAQGALRKSANAYSSYDDMSLDDLEDRANRGDVNAAIIGALKYHAMALEQLGDAGRGKLMHGSDAEQRGEAEKLFASDAWKKQRQLLWNGVTFGSSIAADMMSSSFTTFVGTICLDPDSYFAWSLVSWRMGNWNAGPPVACQISSNGGLARSMVVANRLWDRINYLRAGKGLGPLPFNLRPNHDKWLEIRLDPRKQVPVYRR